MKSWLRRWELWVWLAAVYALLIAATPFLRPDTPAVQQPAVVVPASAPEGDAAPTAAAETQELIPLHAPVLRYRVVNEGARRARLGISLARLDEHLRTLQADGYTVVGLSQVIDALYGDAPLPNRAVALTFDAFNASGTDATVQLLRKHQVRAAFLLPPDRIGKPGAPTAAQLKEMVAAGMDILGAATLSTERTVQRAPDALREQLLAVDQRLKTLGVEPLPVLGLGVVSPTQEEIRALAMAGYHGAVTLRAGTQLDPIRPYELPVVSVIGDLSVEELRKRLAEAPATDREAP